MDISFKLANKHPVHNQSWLFILIEKNIKHIQLSHHKANTQIAKKKSQWSLTWSMNGCMVHGPWFQVRFLFRQDRSPWTGSYSTSSFNTAAFRFKAQFGSLWTGRNTHWPHQLDPSKCNLNTFQGQKLDMFNVIGNPHIQFVTN